MKDHSFETLNRFHYSQQLLGNKHAHTDYKPMGLKWLVFWVISNKKFANVKLECLLNVWGFEPLFYEVNYSSEANIFDVEAVQ